MAASVPHLNKGSLPDILPKLGQTLMSEMPERVVQFGEGGFLRAFVDWMFDTLNRQGMFNGRVALVQPIERGMAGMVNDQDGLYTLLLRGLMKGERVDRTEVIQSVSRCLNPYSQWKDFLSLARQAEIRFMVSNTTEAGIVYVEEPKPSAETGPCPQSFPAKLTAFLFERFSVFGGAKDKGVVLIPCELIDRNGDKLKECVLKHVAAWNLGEPFKAWIENACPLCNTLVDRIVPGYPRDEVDELTAKLGYKDQLLNNCEPFHLWVIETKDKGLAEELPFTKAGLQVVWTDNQTPYRTRKVRMLNGPHTMMVAAAFLSGLETVRDAVEHDVMGKFLRVGLFDEIMPQLPFPQEEKQAFAEAILERFGNPFIKHLLISITLNATSKYKVRVLPSVKEYLERTGKVPAVLSFGLAANLAFTRATELSGDHLVGRRDGAEFKVYDDVPCLEKYVAAWRAFEAAGGEGAAKRPRVSAAQGGKDDGSVAGLVRTLLGDESLWSEDLTALPGLEAAVTTHLTAILEKGCLEAARDLLA